MKIADRFISRGSSLRAAVEAVARAACRAAVFAGLAVGAIGCAAGGPRADSVQPLQISAPAPGFGYDAFGRYVFGYDGARLRLEAFPAVNKRGDPTAPEMVVVAVHGYGEHARLTYARAAEVWSRRGVATYAYDQRGFGRNVSRGAWPGAEALVKDLAYVVQAVRKTHPTKPIGLIGHSMGGGVSMIALGEGYTPEVDAAVLLAPATHGGDTLEDYLRALVWLYAAMAPDDRLDGSGLGAVEVTDDEAERALLARDPHYLGQGSAREYLGVVRLMDRAVLAASGIKTPVLLMWGAKDEIIPGNAIRAAYARIPEPKAYIEYADGYHLLIRDKIGATARKATLDYLLKTAPEAHSKK